MVHIIYNKKNILKDVDLASVIEHYTGQSIQRENGGKIHITCPSPDHSDSHPSALLYPGKGIYANENSLDTQNRPQQCKCMACGFTANAIDLVMAYNKDYSFPRACQELMDIAGLDISEDYIDNFDEYQSEMKLGNIPKEDIFPLSSKELYLLGMISKRDKVDLSVLYQIPLKEKDAIEFPSLKECWKDDKMTINQMLLGKIKEKIGDTTTKYNQLYRYLMKELWEGYSQKDKENSYKYYKKWVPIFELRKKNEKELDNIQKEYRNLERDTKKQFNEAVEKDYTINKAKDEKGKAKKEYLYPLYDKKKILEDKLKIIEEEYKKKSDDWREINAFFCEFTLQSIESEILDVEEKIREVRTTILEPIDKKIEKHKEGLAFYGEEKLKAAREAIEKHKIKLNNNLNAKKKELGLDKLSEYQNDLVSIYIIDKETREDLMKLSKNLNILKESEEKVRESITAIRKSNEEKDSR